jgi:hypothetical protein
MRFRRVGSSSTFPFGRRDEGRARQVQLGLGPPEELDVLRVRARPAPLDVGDAQPVELLGDSQLVLDGRRHALHLKAVAQCGVEDLDPFSRAHGGNSLTGLDDRTIRWGNETAAPRAADVRTWDDHVR